MQMLMSGQMAVTVEGLSPRVQDIHRRVKDLIEEHVLPLEAELLQKSLDRDSRWVVHPRVEQLKVCGSTTSWFMCCGFDASFCMFLNSVWFSFGPQCVCVCVCVCVLMNVCTCACVQACVGVCLCVHESVSLYVYVHGFLHAHNMYICVSTHTCA